MAMLQKKARVAHALAEAGLVLDDDQANALCDTLDAMDRLRSLLRDDTSPRHRSAEPAHTFKLEVEGRGE
jgi:hypothetical protein